MIRRITTAFGAAILALSAGIMVTPAGASTGNLTGLNANTQLTNRPDSGGNGDWALDSIFRTLNIQLVGGTSGHWDYVATVTDLGTFRTINHAYTPNQGTPYHNERIAQVTAGRMSGNTTYVFTASSLPDMNLVPKTETGAPAANSPQTTGYWFEQAFPAGTTFGGPGELGYTWFYQGPSCAPSGPQTWLDSSSNSDGQISSAGNITGFCA